MIETGLQFHLPSHRELTTKDLLRLGQMAEAGGVNQLWATDNLQSRNLFVVLTALASGVGVKLGSAVMVQYFRSPIEAAASLATLTELMVGSELSVGIGRGNITTGTLVETTKPLTVMRETALALRRLLDGDELSASEIPALTEYFRLQPTSLFRLKVRPRVPVGLYCGGDGPRSIQVGGRHMDGWLCGPMFRPLAAVGRLESLIEGFDSAASTAGRTEAPRRVAEIKIALDRDPAASRGYARNDVANRVLGLRWRGFSADELDVLGIHNGEIDRLEAAQRERARPEVMAGLVTDAMIDAFYVTGDVARCREEAARMVALAESLRFDQVIFSGISADIDHGIRLLIDEVLPSLS